MMYLSLLIIVTTATGNIFITTASQISNIIDRQNSSLTNYVSWINGSQTLMYLLLMVP